MSLPIVVMAEMADLLRSLRPLEPIPPDVVISALRSWVPSPAPQSFQAITIDSKTRKTHLFFIVLFSTPRFCDFVQNLKPFTTAEELQFGPELCGKDLYDRYVKDATIAFQFRNVPNELLDTARKSISFLGPIIPLYDDDLGSFVNFLQQVIDNANSWPYLPLPPKVSGLLFDNPIRQLFGSRRLNTAEFYHHIYRARNGEPVQSVILDSCPLLDAPQAICVVPDPASPFLARDLPSAVSLPLGVPKDTFLHICERCAAWEKSGAPNRALVLEAYRGVVAVETYALVGFVGSRAGAPAFAVVAKNVTKHKTVPFELAGSTDVAIHAAVYSRTS